MSNPGSCSVHSEGRLTEDWKFARGRGVVLEFRRIKGTHTVFLQRKGHPAGDVSFATPGTVIRTASGFWDEMGPAPCRGHHEFSVADCDTKLPAKADMFFIWARGSSRWSPRRRASSERTRLPRVAAAPRTSTAGLLTPHREGSFIREDEVFGGSARLVLSRLR